ILNYDDNSFSQMKNKAEEESLRVVSFGTKNGSDFKMLSCLEAANGSRVEGNLFQQKVYFSLQIPSYKIAYNSLAAILAGFVSGFDIHKLTNTISKIDTLGDDDSKEIIPLDNFQNPITLINESSSASPESMNAAFKVLALIDPGRGGRRIAVLGDMLECGQDTNKSHEDLALPLKAANVDLVYTCGTKMKNLYKNLPANQRGKHSLDSKELAQIVPEVLIPGDVVLVKGALGSKMNTVVEALRKLPEKFKKATQN
ncbi:MAG: Mur ligase family protein, partial [Pseudomonadota bacterium]